MATKKKKSVRVLGLFGAKERDQRLTEAFDKIVREMPPSYKRRVQLIKFVSV